MYQTKKKTLKKKTKKKNKDPFTYCASEVCSPPGHQPHQLEHHSRITCQFGFVLNVSPLQNNGPYSNENVTGDYFQAKLCWVKQSGRDAVNCSDQAWQPFRTSELNQLELQCSHAAHCSAKQQSEQSVFVIHHYSQFCTMCQIHFHETHNTRAHTHILPRLGLSKFVLH